MKKNFKEMARQFEEALLNGDVENIVYHTVNGNYSEKDYNTVIKYLDIDKANFGKRNFNLIAYVGNKTIKQYFIDEFENYLNRNQTVTIYKYLSDIAKDKFNGLVKATLIEFYKDL
jgi:hypothetical protein